MNVRRPLVVLAVALAILSLAPAADAGRIVAVGDVHGNVDGLGLILRDAGIIDENGHWAGGDATYVQLGDVFDRGVHVRAVLDLLMRLQKEAPKSGGRIVFILGNHEVMNLTGFYRDANPEAYAAFADGKSEKRRNKLWKAVKRYRELRSLPIDDAAEQAWMADHPPGWIEYVDALGPDGRYGAWLRRQPAALMIDGVLFIHGGIGPSMAGETVESINATVHEELAVYDRAHRYLVSKSLLPPTAGVVDVGRMVQAILVEADKPDSTDFARQSAAQLREVADLDRWMSMSPDGPLWFRGAAQWDEAEHEVEMDALLDGIGARVMVVGHTPNPEGRIRVRFDGRVVLIDTGILSSYYTGGRPSALEIDGGTFTAIYPDDRVLLPVAEPLDRAAALTPQVPDAREAVAAR